MAEAKNKTEATYAEILKAKNPEQTRKGIMDPTLQQQITQSMTSPQKKLQSNDTNQPCNFGINSINFEGLTEAVIKLANQFLGQNQERDSMIKTIALLIKPIISAAINSHQSSANAHLNQTQNGE